MAEPTLAVLLRNGTHVTATIRYALKCNDIAISYARTPIQIPISQDSPEIIDLGFVRPSLTCTGVIDTIGGDTTNETARFVGMENFAYSRTTASNATYSTDGGGTGGTENQTYYIPYKNALEEAVATWMYQGGDTPLEVEIGDSKFPIDSYSGYLDAKGGSSTANRFIAGQAENHATGGAIYEVAIQQGRFSLNAAKEDRYDFTLQFVITRRIDIP